MAAAAAAAAKVVAVAVVVTTVAAAATVWRRRRRDRHPHAGGRGTFGDPPSTPQTVEPLLRRPSCPRLLYPSHLLPQTRLAPSLCHCNVHCAAAADVGAAADAAAAADATAAAAAAAAAAATAAAADGLKSLSQRPRLRHAGRAALDS